MTPQFDDRWSRWLLATISDPEVVAADLVKHSFGPGGMELDVSRSVCPALRTPRSLASRKLIKSGAEERVAAFGDGRCVQRAAVAGKPRHPSV